jgi:predicted cupin superfamily sugar epimerase
MTDWTASDFTEHPEGGRFRELYRSPETVRRENRPDRPSCTHIYFQLNQGEVSRFHKVEQEEIWNLYRGALSLWIFDETTEHLEEVTISAETNTFCAVVPAGCWQAAEPLSADVLVGCTVAPGFDFEDFTLIKPVSPLAQRLSTLGLERFV